MPGNAALLIDLENFYIGREDNWTKSHAGESYEFPVDLDSLCAFAKDIAAGRRLTVQRAYANYNDRRPGAGERRWDYYLQPQPRFPYFLPSALTRLPPASSSRSRSGDSRRLSHSSCARL